MAARRKIDVPTKLVEEWRLPAAATLGSSVRVKGILLEVRAQLSVAARKLLNVEHGMLTFRVPEGCAYNDLQSVSTIVSTTLERIEDLPVIPREVEDILTISTSERIGG